MNLNDAQVLELHTLCCAVIDGTITDAQRTRLSRWLQESPAARRYYVRVLGQSASLHSYAAEQQAEAPDAPAMSASRGQVIAFSKWWAVAISAAAAAAIVAGIFLFSRSATATEKSPTFTHETTPYIAHLTGAKDPHWAAGTLAAGAHLRKGQKLELTSGYAEITFDCGARVVLEGAASLELNSAWDATLRRGTLKASVPHEAIGFRIANPAVEVVDLGTEFTMIADGKGSAEVLVLKGEVEAAPRAASEPDAILLKEKESRRFASSGVTSVSDSEQKFAQATQPLALDRFVPATNVVHWSFDESDGTVAHADPQGGMSSGAYDATLVAAQPDALAQAHAEGQGRSAHALHFDGHLFAKAHFPGLSGDSARTVAFWVKVPEDAANDAWMVSWGTTIQRLNNRPVQISWNRRPAEGALGALRTDFGGGHAIGTTSLRDGKWHHVTVYFAPSDDADLPVQVKQYIDGRLESSTISLDAVRARAGTGDGTELDTVFLGSRLTAGKRFQPERFRGEIDELFIADRNLEPNEIVSLMRDNRLPVAGLAASQ